MIKTKCKLCRENDLDNTGAHIFSDALIRSGLYIDGKFKRGDYEAIAVVSRKKVGFTYFGASVLAEKRAELLGKPQTEKEIAETSEHSFINRELVCRPCERKFNPVETYFVTQVYQKILDSDKCEGGKFEFNEHINRVTFLMMLINIWRASASKFNDWHIKDEDEEFIRVYLNKVLISDDIDKIKDEARKFHEKVSKFKFQLLVSEQTDGKLSENLIFADHPDKPFTIYLNRLIILFSENGFSDFEIPALLQPYITKRSIEQTQNDETKLTIYQLKNDQRKELIISYFDREWKQWVKEAAEKLKALVKSKFWREITSAELECFHNVWKSKLGNKEPPTSELLEESIKITLQILQTDNK